MSDYLVSMIRTAVPIAVGWAITSLASLGVEMDEASAVAAVTSLVIGVYYAVVRAAERRWPQVGWLLGRPTQPAYTDA